VERQKGRRKKNAGRGKKTRVNKKSLRALATKKTLLRRNGWLHLESNRVQKGIRLGEKILVRGELLSKGKKRRKDLFSKMKSFLGRDA